MPMGRLTQLRCRGHSRAGAIVDSKSSGLTRKCLTLYLIREEENCLDQDELKSLASEEYTDREDKLFRPGFLEKASKRMESEKALAKVMDPGPSRKQILQDEKESFYPKAPLPGTEAGDFSTIQDRTRQARRRYSTSQSPSPPRGPNRSTYSSRETPILRTGMETDYIRPLGSGSG